MDNLAKVESPSPVLQQKAKGNWKNEQLERDIGALLMQCGCIPINSYICFPDPPASFSFSVHCI